jgi:predicted nucleic acid-binding protein
MNVVDSSAWLEYFADGPNAAFFASAVEDVPGLVVPTISIYEVFKRVRQQRGEAEALQAIAVMAQGRIVSLDMDLALRAAELSADLGLPMADSIILATARTYEAILWTQDVHFAEIGNVRYAPKH